MLWAGDARVKVLKNIEAYGRDVALVTITAPGRDRLPYGDDGRYVRRDVAYEWNRLARVEWRKLQRKAAQRAARFARRNGGEWAALAGTWEFQRRGVLHRHQVVPMGTPLERMASQIYAEALSELAPRHEFGFVDRGRKSSAAAVWKRSLEVIPAQRAARYVAKYLAACKSDGRLALSETVRHPDVPGHVVYVSRRLTARTGCTMQRLRDKRWAHMLRRGDLGNVLGLCEACGHVPMYASDDDVVQLARRLRAPPDESGR